MKVSLSKMFWQRNYKLTLTQLSSFLSFIRKYDLRPAGEYDDDYAVYDITEEIFTEFKLRFL